MFSAYFNLLKKALTENKIQLDETTQEKLAQYLALLNKWNTVFNLTTITSVKDMVYLHLMDSLLVQPFLQGKRLLDVGSGAGLPGIPLAIANPSLEWVLLDKNSKKTRFLTQTVAELELKNVTVIHSRCEDFHPVQCFDSILSRAFGSLRLLIEVSRHLLCPNGIFIVMKGKEPKQELDDIPDGFLVKTMTRLTIKGVDVERHIVCAEKS